METSSPGQDELRAYLSLLVRSVVKVARELTLRAMDNAQRAGEKDAPALYSSTSALREAWFGNTGEARQRAALALKLSSSRDLQYFAALAFAYAKEDARAKTPADDLDKSFQKITIVQFNYLPSVRAGSLCAHQARCRRSRHCQPWARHTL